MTTPTLSMQDHLPLVSFVVPCYKLAHFLPECLDSLLSQTYRNVEVIVMDDCSPDNTPEVIRQYADDRLRFVRNTSNIGHLRNYNKGLSLALGRYIWLISADDTLRCPYIVERYVEFMESHPSAGFVFCPGVSVDSSGEKELITYSFHGHRDTLFPGRRFFNKLIKSNSVLAASGLVRKELYDLVGMFPLDMPFAGDWYLWMLFSLHRDVGYLADPMVTYREHDLSMTTLLREQDTRICAEDDLRALWQIRFRAEESGHANLAVLARDAVVDRASLLLVPGTSRSLRPAYTVSDFEAFVTANSTRRKDSLALRRLVYARSADRAFWGNDFAAAEVLYRLSLELHPCQIKVALQYALIVLGKPGLLLRKAHFVVRRWMAANLA
jgi:glycosyltransferase involved in cell wall biosynthesis